MALAVDASSPAAVRGATATVTTASFSPPAQSALVAFVCADANNGSATESCTVTSTGGLSWSRAPNAQDNGGVGADVEIWIAYTASAPGSITVSVSDNQGAVDQSLFVRVFTGASSSVVGASTHVASSGSITYTSTVAGSWGWACGLGGNAGTLAAGSGCTIRDSTTTGGFDGGDTVFTVSQTSTTANVGTSVTTSASGLNAFVHMAVVEVVPAATDAGPGPLAFRAPGRVAPGGVPLGWAGTGFDIPAAVPVPLTDTGAGSDAVTITVSVPVTDSGSGADAITVTAAVPVGDSGGGADVATTAIAVAIADTGAATDTVTVAAAVPVSDAGSAAETASVAATLTIADTGSGADSSTAGVPIAVADTGTGSDTVTVTATVTLSEAGGGAEALAGTVTLTLTDTAAGSDAARVAAAVPLADSGAAADTVVVSAAVPVADAGSAADTGTGQQTGGPTVITVTDAGGARDRIHVVVTEPTTGTTSRPTGGTTGRPDDGITYYQ